MEIKSSLLLREITKNNQNLYLMENTLPNQEVLFRNPAIRTDLAEAAKWGKFLGIVGFVGVGLMVLACVVLVLAGSALGSYSQTPVPASFLGFFYLVFAAVYFFPVFYLFRFSVAVKRSLATNDETELVAGIANLRRMFKFVGVLTMVCLILYGLVLVVLVPVMILAH